MRGFVFTTIATGILIVSILLLSYILHVTENTVDVPKDFFQARINGGYYFIMKEYKETQVAGSFGPGKAGCVPVLFLNLKGDPISELARPTINYVCGGG